MFAKIKINKFEILDYCIQNVQREREKKGTRIKMVMKAKTVIQEKVVKILSYPCAVNSGFGIIRASNPKAFLYEV